MYICRVWTHSQDKLLQKRHASIQTHDLNFEIMVNSKFQKVMHQKRLTKSVDFANPTNASQNAMKFSVDKLVRCFLSFLTLSCACISYLPMHKSSQNLNYKEFQRIVLHSNTSHSASLIVDDSDLSVQMTCQIHDLNIPGVSYLLRLILLQLHGVIELKWESGANFKRRKCQ